MGIVDKMQVSGNHYLEMDPQPWEVIDKWNLGFFEGNILKYLARWKRKGGVEDLRKLRHYVDKLIEMATEPTAEENNRGDSWVYKGPPIDCSLEGAYEVVYEDYKGD